MFWKGIVELGLADSFFREIKTSIDNLKNSMIKNYVPLGGNVGYTLNISIYYGYDYDYNLVIEIFFLISCMNDSTFHNRFSVHRACLDEYHNCPNLIICIAKY